jgi:formate/nitrite transporter FocA (FNT family)
MIDSVTGASPRQLARIAGALYLINIVGGAFVIGFVRAALKITPDLATTAHNIQTDQLLYRSGLAAHLVVTLTKCIETRYLRLSRPSLT